MLSVGCSAQGFSTPDMPDSEEEPHAPLAEVGRYPRLAEARERALVVAARDLAHWIEREGEEWVLRVEEPVSAEVVRELALFEAEQRARPVPSALLPVGKVETLSLYVAGWLLSAFFFTQCQLGDWWVERGAASSHAILRDGEWWRTITALTLHADLPHVVANIASGLLFAGFVLPQLGTGLTWLAIVLSGAVGNAINAWGYRGEAHLSIGASTAVFGALGLLVGLDVAARISSPHTRGRWQLVLPIGAGLALVAYLGVGEIHEHIDFMAHWWGFVAGIGGGLLAGALRLGERASRGAQRLAAVAAVAAIGGAWWLALRG